jgi:hypothetical protein
LEFAVAGSRPSTFTRRWKCDAADRGFPYRFFHPPRFPGAPPLERGLLPSLTTPPNSCPPSRIDFGL